MNDPVDVPAPGRSNRALWIAVAILVIAIVYLFVPHRPAPTGPTTATSPPASQAPKAARPPEVSVAQAAGLQAQGAFVVDVRQPEEWKEGHISGATLIPLDDLESRLAEVPRDRRVVVVCHSGNRSRKGRDILIQAGYPQVASMSGGLAAWEAAGRPMAKGM